MSQEANHETWHHHTVRKKVKSINMLVVTTGDHIILWKPAPGRQFIPELMLLKVRASAGTFTDGPNVIIDNGVDAETHVADVAVATVQDGIQILAIATARIIDYAHPLRLRITDAPAGGTKVNVDFIGFFHKLSD